MTQYIKKLPAVFQTVTEKKFFDATFDQVFSKKDSELLSGYLGRRNPGTYNPITDFYLPEPSKNRTWWQLEATAFARNADTTKSNVFFYEDLLEYIEYYGGNTLNQDRLFESEYYSFGPPIDYDMFVNYQSYYWIEQGLPTISIEGVLASDIIGKSSYTTPAEAIPPNFTLTSGMSISLVSDPDYSAVHTVENLGNCLGIRLVPQFPDFTAGTLFEFLPWDGVFELSTGRIIDNRYWDATSWETEAQPSSGDYITIERGSLDRNAWSRTNKWFHIDAITQTIAQTGTVFPSNATRGLRPIIQFIADLILYKSGTQFRSEIQYGFRDNQYGIPLLLANFQGRSETYINSTLSISIAEGDLVCFFNDNTPFDSDLFPWDDIDWDETDWDEGEQFPINHYIFRTHIDPDTDAVIFTPYTSVLTPILEGDIVFITEDAPFDGALRGQTWYYSNGVWQEAFNDKISVNQPPRFQLYDHDTIPLDDSAKYPNSSFVGSEIFSYKVNTEPGATVDPVLKFPIVYTSLGQASDIIFQNDLITTRYTYDINTPIDGYYYYKTITNPVTFNNWNLYQPCPCPEIVPPPPCNCLEVSKQRVIDKYVVGYGTLYQFALSVEPFGYPASPDIIVSVNGTEIKSIADAPGTGYSLVVINNTIYVDLSLYLTALFNSAQTVAPVVEIQTYTHGLLDPKAPGYFEIPQQLEANPSQLEVGEISGSDLTQQFSSIISNQIGIEGTSFGGSNNYRDTYKDRSVGQYILQNVAPTLKSMLVASSDDLDFIEGIRFSQSEYTKFKNKYLRTANQLINQGFDPVQYYTNTVSISLWVEEILKIVNISKEFSSAFAYSYMIANGSPFANETVTIPPGGLVTLSNYVDLSDPRNAIYLYDTTGQETLLVIGENYEIVSTNLEIDIQFVVDETNIGHDVYVALYKNPLPAYIPSTPTKVGAYPAFVPRMEYDTSYVVPTNVIIGHDGSKTIAYGDYRDELLLELEKRIYNLLQYKFRHEYYVPLRIESVKSGFFKETRYSREEYLEITESYLNKWSSMNRANYRANDWASASQTTPVQDLWKLYNYRVAVNPSDAPLNLPGNWKGIYQYCYDTIYPDSRPWEMLGFSHQPIWWQEEYGAPVLNGAGQQVWTSTASNLHSMWDDLEAGIIRQGPSAIYDPITLLPQPQPDWERPGLSAYIPVDGAGEIISVMTLFNVAFSGNPYEPFDGFDLDWVYGDGSPVEQAWMSTSTYAYNVQEFLYLMRPGPYGELMWDTVGTELSPGMIEVPDIESPVMSNTNWQYVQNDTYSFDDPFFTWMRPKNIDQVVHAESVDTVVQIRFGYQRWISDRILFLGKDVGDTFGQKIRTLDVNLANKLAGFTNKDTTNTYIESVSPGSSTSSLIIPSTNFDVLLHTSPVVDTYSYSGIVIRALADGTFVVYGYDLLTSEFTVFDRSNDKIIDLSVGGTPAEFRYFAINEVYAAGDIVRYNGVYYVSLNTQLITPKFDPTQWQKLKALPTIGGISVKYKPVSLPTITKIPYGAIMKSAQEVFDLMIGWGAWLESRGWQFQEVSQQTNLVSDWLSSAKQYLFWLNTEWAPDASIQLSPLANKATLIVDRGYPNDVEAMSNGVYSILDKYGVAIAPENTDTDRDGPLISVEPTNLSVGGIFYLQVNTSETEHVLIFDNTTSFNDTIYSPLLRARQQRLRFYGFRSNGWYGKMEAPGYLVIENQLVPNFDTIVNAMRYYYDPNVTIDNPSLEDLGRHLIGYESKSYLDNLQVSDDVQYLFYQGAIRQKGTEQAFDKLFRSTKVQGNKIIEVFEEWALKLADFGNTIEQVSTEFRLLPEQNTGEVVVARLNYVPSTVGFVKQINILNAENIYSTVPKVVITEPDATPAVWAPYSAGTSYVIGDTVREDDSRGNPIYYSATVNIPVAPAIFDSSTWTVVLATRYAKAYIVLDTVGRIARVDVSDPGYGYLNAPYVEIDSGSEPHNLDRLFSIWQGAIISDTTLDNIINIDIDNTAQWTVRPADPTFSLVFPETPRVDYPLPNAGYVNFNDVDLTSFGVVETVVGWGTKDFNPVKNQTLWIAKTFTEDWDVYKLVPQSTAFEVIEDLSGNLVLRTPLSYMLTPQFSGGVHSTDFGNLIVLQVNEARAAISVGDAPIERATATAIVPSTPAATSILSGGSVSGVTVTNAGAGYTFTPQVSFSDSPTGFTAFGIAEIVDGKLVDITVTTIGSGYVTPPTITIEAPTGAGTVFAINITDGGSGYTIVPTVSITGDGVGASATAVLTNGIVTDITINNGGAGYTNATITIGNSVHTGGITDIELTKVGSNYINAPIVTIGGTHTVQATATATIAGGQVSEITITNPGSGYTDTGVGAATVTIAPPRSINPDTNFAVAFQYIPANAAPDANYNYYSLITLEGDYITATDIPQFADFTDLILFKTMRFLALPVITLPDYAVDGDKIWVDRIVSGSTTLPVWSVYQKIAPSISHPAGYYSVYRQQEELINSSLFESASVFSTNTSDQIVQLPVYDPFKNILPGPAKQNITYVSLQDPARYNVTADQRLFSENIIFGKRQTGQLWWDLSTTRYVYYEQPIAMNPDGSEAETELNNMIYRRDHWGQLFPGSTVNIYEWVESDVIPADYTGSGTPKDTSTYVQIITSNRFTNATEIKYYFWVLNTTDKPNIENRTMAALDVSRLLQSPKSQGFAFFAPIQQTSTNNSYMFYNVQEILAYQGDNIQVQYRVAERDDQKHTQWSFFREGDSGSTVTDQFWNKLVDSLCGYTQVLPVSNEYDNGIIIADNLPWDIYGWDITPWDSATTSSSPVYGEILEVPDPTLSEGEKYGIKYRPRQGMFVYLESARKVFVQSANALLKYIPIRDNNPGWNADVETDVYWTYTNWYEVGYEDAVPTIVFQTLAQANTALISGQLNVNSIVQVTNGTIDGRFVLYAVIQLDPNVSVLSLEEVGIQDSAIELLPTVYTVENVYGLAVELRQLMNAFRTEVMVDANLVDQNMLYFSMLNYVVSEQKNPDWVFKTSYIYIKEDDLPLSQDLLYIPDQIDNIIDYINESKPYHTKIRDYTSTYLTSDIAFGTAMDFPPVFNIILDFGPPQLGPTELSPYPSYSGQDTNSVNAVFGWDLDTTGYQLEWDQFEQLTVVSGSGNVVTVASTNGLLIGTLVQSISGTGVLPDGTTITAILNSTDFVLSNTPTTPFDAGDIIRLRNMWDTPVDIHGTPLTLNNIVNQSISGSHPMPIIPGDWPGNTVPLVAYTGAAAIQKMGYSTLFPYQFVAPTLDDPQTFVPPESIVGVQADDQVLYYGQDYYAEYNESTNDYTVYFYNDPSVYSTLVGLVWFDGGNLMNVQFDTYRNELVFGYPKDDFVVNVDTKLPLTLDSNDGNYYVIADMWDFQDPVLESILEDLNGPPPSGTWIGFDNTMWDQSDSSPYPSGYADEVIDLSLSFKENVQMGHNQAFYRNSEFFSGALVQPLAAPTTETENVAEIIVTSPNDVFPEPFPSAAVWIDGERIVYGLKTQHGPNEWTLGLIVRGTNGTAPTDHIAGATAFVEKGNIMPFGSSTDVWDAIDSNSVDGSNVNSVPQGGIWYAQTPEAVFLKAEHGKSVP